MIAILVVGGYGDVTVERSVEALHADGTPLCTLEPLPEGQNRFAQSQAGLLVCGGLQSMHCITYTLGN